MARKKKETEAPEVGTKDPVAPSGSPSPTSGPPDQETPLPPNTFLLPSGNLITYN